MKLTDYEREREREREREKEWESEWKKKRNISVLFKPPEMFVGESWLSHFPTQTVYQVYYSNVKAQHFAGRKEKSSG